MNANLETPLQFPSVSCHAPLGFFQIHAEGSKFTVGLTFNSPWTTFSKDVQP
jgi:hypothetical protein